MVIRSSRFWSGLMKRGAFTTFVVVSLTAMGVEQPKSLQERVDAASPGAVLQVGAGTFEGNLILHKPVSLVGAGPDTVLRGGEGSTVQVMSRDVVLRRMSIEGEVALEVLNRAGFTGEHLNLRGRTAVVLAGEGAQVTLSDSMLTGTPTAEAPCAAVMAVRDAVVHAQRLVLRGKCRRSLEATSSRLLLRNVSMKEAQSTGVQFADSEVELEQVDASTESREMAAAFAARSFVKGTGLVLRGGLQGWLQKSGRTVLSNVDVAGVSAAGIALIGGTCTLSSVRMTGPFTQAGIFLSENARVDVDDLDIKRTGAVGVLVNRSDAKVVQARFSGVRFDRDGDFGHAIVAERSRLTVSRADVEDAAGAAIFASQPPSSVDVDGLAVKDVGVGLVTLEGARVTATGLKGGTLATVSFASGESTIELSNAQVSAPTGAVECSGSSVHYGHGVNLTTVRARLSCDEDESDRLWKQLLAPKR